MEVQLSPSMTDWNLTFFVTFSLHMKNIKVHLTPKYICSWNKCLCYVKKVGAFFFYLNDSSIFYVLLKSRNIWLKSAFIRDLGRVELWRRKENGMRLLATIITLVSSFSVAWNSIVLSDPLKTYLVTVVHERQRSLAISLKFVDFSHRPNLLNERNLPFWNAQSTALKIGMVPISLASAEQNPPISFSFSWLQAYRRRKMVV